VDAWNVAAGLARTGGAGGAIGQAFQQAELDGANGIVRAEIAEGNHRQQAQSNAFQSQAGVNAFGFGQQAAGLDVSSGRNSQAADFQAKSAQYDAERNYASSIGGELAAMGAGGAVSVGAKPVGMEPMAMTGQLGRDMQKRAGFAENQFQSFLQSGQAKLQGAYGYGATASRFQSGDGAALMGRVAERSQGMGGFIPPGGFSGGVQDASAAAYGADGSLKPQNLAAPQQGNPAPQAQHPNLGMIGAQK
jgi:hypothetical protein